MSDIPQYDFTPNIPWREKSLKSKIYTILAVIITLIVFALWGWAD